MSTIKLKDGTEFYYKDWGKGQPIVFHHGWPLSGDDWDAQMMFFLSEGYRVIAHDRRGHGRSGQSSEGNDMDTYAADIAELTTALDLKDAIHIGHSTGGGEVIRYAAKYGKGRVSKAIIISAVPPIMVQSETNPEGVPRSIFDEIRKGTGFNRAQFYYDFPIPFYGWNREGTTVQEGIKQNWWRQGMMGSVLAHYHGIKAFSESDFTDDLISLDIPVLVMHGEDDQVVPYHQAPKSAKLLKHGKLISYPGFPHGMPTTEAETINKDILEFIKG